MIIGITLFLLILIEIIFKVYFLFYTIEDPRANADCYPDEPWVKEYYQEFTSSNSATWQPYVYWSRKPFSGEYINIDKEGIRKTSFKLHPFIPGSPPTKIFFFGGSSMWGSGVRDAYTIPSLTGNNLSRKAYNTQISNFGESGFVSTQELIRLMIELRKGNIPDIAVFYHGANDIFSCLQSGVAGIPQNEDNRNKEFNTLKEKKKSFLVFLQSLSNLSTIKFVNVKFGRKQMKFVDRDEDESNLLAGKTVLLYNENIRIINALAKQYGFQALFYWQPLIFDKPGLTAYEAGEIKKVKALQSFSGKVQNELFSGNIKFENIRFDNISIIFKQVDQAVFIDWCHTGEFGNEVIAQRISNDLVSVIDSINIKKNE